MVSSNVKPSRSSDLCQIETAPKAAALRRPGFLYVPMRILQNLRNRGFRYTFSATFGPRVKSLRRTLRRPEVACSRTPECPDAVLNLVPGELVEVKSLEEILRTLDSNGRHYGLAFTPEMKRHCGKQYRVFKRLELMFDEYHKSQRRVKNTVLLESVFCEGAGLGCHRSCFLYWREAWLRRV